MNLVSKRLLAGVASFALVAGACSSTAATPTAAPASQAPTTAPASQAATPAPTTAPAAKVTVNWWHISTDDIGKPLFQSIADAYVAAHPNVTIKVTVLENEAFKTKLKNDLASNSIPDLFQSWGGGGMAEQVEAGKLQDITAAIKDWAGTINEGALGIYAYKGKQYGIPWDMGMIGFWYNKAIFTKAGVQVPTTWAGLLDVMKTIKSKAGVAPLAIAGKDMWPSMHLWTYLVLRMAGYDALQEMIQTGNWSTDSCKAAGDAVLELNKLQPYQQGYQSATYDNEAAAVANGKAAMELMGQWAPAVQKNDAANKKGLGDDLGWFAFPAVDGGKGDGADGVGGGNGIAVGAKAPAEAVDFLKFFSTVDTAKKLIATGTASPVKETSQFVTDANLKMVVEGRDKAKHIQLYLDQATNSAMGTAINKATIKLFLGAGQPDKVCQELTDAAKTTK